VKELSNALASLMIGGYDQIVYHYCGPSVFESIVESRCIWAADLRSANDPREVRDGGSAVKEFLSKSSYPEGSVSNTFVRNVSSSFDQFSSELRFFASLFTYEKDHLYSWLHYGGRGQGLAIGIRKAAFPAYRWNDITYDRAAFDASIQSIWRAGLEAYAACVTDPEKLQREHFTAIEFLEAVGAYKHFSWASEREARLSIPVFLSRKDGRAEFQAISSLHDYIVDGKIDFRSHARGIRPFARMRLDHEDIMEDDRSRAIAQVIIGPNSAVQGEVVEAFLAANGYTDFIVENSACQFTL
jgi:hypothetical protein